MCRDVPIGDQKEHYDSIGALLEPFCVAPMHFNAGWLSDTPPWTAYYTCHVNAG